jgi:hypothetical protein
VLPSAAPKEAPKPYSPEEPDPATPTTTTLPFYETGRYRPARTEEIDQRHCALKIEQALQGRGTEPTSQPQPTHPLSKAVINIAAIGAVAFH